MPDDFTMPARIKANAVITDDYPAVVNTVLKGLAFEGDESPSDKEVLDRAMKFCAGMTNPVKMAEEIVRQRGGDRSIITKPASPFNFVGEKTHSLTPIRHPDGSVTWEPASSCMA